MTNYILNPYLHYSSNPPIIFNLLTADIIQCDKKLLFALRQFMKNTAVNDIQLLIDSSVIIKQEFLNKIEKIFLGPKQYLPTSLTLLPTWDCNMRCIYCYSNGGVGDTSLMSLKVAQAGIDTIISNSLILAQNRKDYNQKSKHHRNNCDTNLNFHGGGEPLLEKNQELLTKMIEYYKSTANQNNLGSEVSVTTNGAITKNRYSWVTKNIDQFTISFDGPSEIQNSQRPLTDGNSFELTDKFVKHLDNNKKHYIIRATITNESVHQLVEIVEFFADNYSVKKIHVEPLFSCGRCHSNPDLVPEKDTFTSNYYKAKGIAKKLNIDLHYSGNRNCNSSGVFCGAASGSNFFITPNGKVTTCLEVSRESDPGTEVFHVGQYNDITESFDIDEQKIAELRTRNVMNLEGCVNCIARLSCAGGCLSKAYFSKGNIHKTGNLWWCKVHRDLLLKEIQDQL